MDLGFDLLGRGGLDLHPRPFLGLEDLRQAQGAVAAVDAKLRLPNDRQLSVAVLVRLNAHN